MKTWKERVAGSDWNTADKALFIRFAEKAQLKRRPAGEVRIEKYRTDLVITQTMTRTSISGMVRNMKSLEKAVKAINSNRRYSYITKKDAKRTMGSLFNFKHNGDVSLAYAPRELKELIAHDAKPGDRRLAREVISREEMREMLRFGDTLDRAIISLLFDSGMRMGEFEKLTKSDIRPIKEGIEVRVPPGKTGERMVVVVEAKSYVNRWLEEHPNKDKEGPLWLSLDRILMVGGKKDKKKAVRKPIGAAGLAKRIRLVVERMNMRRKKKGLPLFAKPYNPHNFRHSRASELGGQLGMTEAIMCKYFGWEIGSDMPKTYLHLTDDQVKRAVLATYGRVKKAEAREILTHQFCRACKAENPLGKQFCADCGTPLDSDKEVTRIGKLEEEIKGLKEMYERLLKREIKRRVVK